MPAEQLPTPEHHPFVASVADESAGHSSPDSDSDGQAVPVSVSPHAIAMRIMRRDNYLIALMNKDVLKLGITVCERLVRGVLTLFPRPCCAHAAARLWKR